MGFFSQQCEECEASILSIYSTNEVNAWMMEAVVITPNGSIIMGTYDGYGRIDAGGTEVEDAIGYSNTTYHKACWELAGRPTAYRGESERARDQGFFFDDDEPQYSRPDPRKASRR